MLLIGFLQSIKTVIYHRNTIEIYYNKLLANMSFINSLKLLSNLDLLLSAVVVVLFLSNQV